VVDEATRSRRKLAAIVMVDVSGFSRMMTRDEEWTTREIQAFHARVRERVAEFEGRVVDTAGDSVFSEFDSVVLATRCARAIQEDQALRNTDVAPEQRIETRIGVHVGDVIVEEHKIYGDGVNIAARLESLAEPGGILVSDAVYQQVRNKVPGEFRDEGVRELKNIDHPVRVYRMEPSALVASAPRPAARPAMQAPAQTRPPTRREERMAQRARRFRTRERERDLPVRSPADVLLRVGIMAPLLIGVFLLASPLFELPSGGTFPTGGAILVGLTLGRIMQRLRRRRGDVLVGLGLGIAFGALLTHWSGSTNFLFLLGGAIVAARGLALTRQTSARAR
jgi:class 3 adenylate cyclase